MGKGNIPEEQEAREKLREIRDKLLKQIRNYSDDEFPTDEAEKAVQHSWSILSRLESELEKVPEDETLLEDLKEDKEEYYDTSTKRAMVRIYESEYNRLLKRLERLEAKCSRVSILSTLSQANRKLGQQMLEGLKMETEKVKVDYIEISLHATVLKCFKDVLYIALRRLGHTDSQMQALAKEMKRIEKDYPLLEEDKKAIMKRLFGEPDEVIDVEYSVVPKIDGPALLEEINAEVSGKHKKRRHAEK